MIELQMRGFLGNNLFQYAIGRILSEELGYALEVRQSTYKPSLNVPHVKELFSLFNDAPFQIDGMRFDSPIDDTYNYSLKRFDGYHIDISSVVNDQNHRKLRVNGSFERYEIFQPYKKRIREWFEIDPLSMGHSIKENDIILHVRWGDFVLFGRAISLRFYLEILERIEFGRLYICGYGLDKEIRNAFHKFNPTYISGSAVEDFRFIKGFNRIIQSPSTFVWWASFLSDAEEIYMPITDPSQLPVKWPIDLRVMDEPRYHHVENVPLLERDYTLGDVINSWSLLPFSKKKKFLGRLIKRSLRA